MAGLLIWIAQDILKRKERDGTASEMMKEGNIRRWKEIHQSSCPFFSPARFYTREGVSYCHVLFFSLRCYSSFYYVSFSFTLPGGAIN
jgi:hypothetical protein